MQGERVRAVMVRCLAQGHLGTRKEPGDRAATLRLPANPRRSNKSQSSYLDKNVLGDLIDGFGPCFNVRNVNNFCNEVVMLTGNCATGGGN